MSKSIEEKMSFSVAELDIEILKELDLNLSLRENLDRAIDHQLNFEIA